MLAELLVYAASYRTTPPAFRPLFGRGDRVVGPWPAPDPRLGPASRQLARADRHHHRRPRPASHRRGARLRLPVRRAGRIAGPHLQTRHPHRPHPPVAGRAAHLPLRQCDPRVARPLHRAQPRCAGLPRYRGGPRLGDLAEPRQPAGACGQVQVPSAASSTAISTSWPDCPARPRLSPISTTGCSTGTASCSTAPTCCMAGRCRAVACAGSGRWRRSVKKAAPPAVSIRLPPGPTGARPDCLRRAWRRVSR